MPSPAPAVFHAQMAVTCLRAGGWMQVADRALWALDFLDGPQLDQMVAINCPSLILSRQRLAQLGLDTDDQFTALRLPEYTTASTLWALALSNPQELGDLSLAGLQEPVEPKLAQSLSKLAEFAGILPAFISCDCAGDAKGVEGDQADLGIWLDVDAIASTDIFGTLAQSLVQVGATPISLRSFGPAKFHLFRDALGHDEHVAIELGERGMRAGPDNSPPTLVRLHSSCLTGDIFGSVRCDCGPQLHNALAGMKARGHGILVYLAQEGRGIGLTNKLRSYLLQQSGLDTVDGNLALGFGDDLRDFRFAAQILKLLGHEQIELMTNNPRKVAGLAKAGIQVAKRSALIAADTPESARYLSDKAARSGHIVPADLVEPS